MYVNVASLKQTVGTTTTSCKHCKHCTGTTRLFGLCTLQHVQLSRSIGLQGEPGVWHMFALCWLKTSTRNTLLLCLAWLANGEGGVYHSINSVVREIIAHDHKLWHKLWSQLVRELWSQHFAAPSVCRLSTMAAVFLQHHRLQNNPSFTL